MVRIFFYLPYSITTFSDLTKLFFLATEEEHPYVPEEEKDGNEVEEEEENCMRTEKPMLKASETIKGAYIFYLPYSITTFSDLTIVFLATEEELPYVAEEETDQMR